MTKSKEGVPVPISAAHPACAELAEALQLPKHTLRMSLVIDWNSSAEVVVKAAFVPTIDQLEEITEVVEKYSLWAVPQDQVRHAKEVAASDGDHPGHNSSTG
jgi:hypothetical protein